MKTRTLLGFGFAAMAAWIGLLASARHRVAPAPLDPGLPRNPYLDRRGPNRPANIVRPAFGKRLPPASPPPSRTGDWEAF